MLRRYVNRDIGREIGQVIEQNRRLAAAPAPVLDQHGSASDAGADLIDVCVEDSHLRTGRIVLLQLRDLFEQLGAPFVIEELARQLPDGLAQPIEDLLHEALRLRSKISDFRGSGHTRWNHS